MIEHICELQSPFRTVSRFPTSRLRRVIALAPVPVRMDSSWRAMTHLSRKKHEADKRDGMMGITLSEYAFNHLRGPRAPATGFKNN